MFYQTLLIGLYCQFLLLLVLFCALVLDQSDSITRALDTSVIIQNIAATICMLLVYAQPILALVYACEPDASEAFWSKRVPLFAISVCLSICLFFVVMFFLITTMPLP